MDGSNTGAKDLTKKVTTITTRKYYAIAAPLATLGDAPFHTAGQTVAMDDGSGLKYLLTDHLDSTVGVTDATGELISQQCYLPFGEIRNIGVSITQTDFGYTGQRNLPDTGLMDYKDRMYDPYLKRFIQPDSIVSGAGNPQSWNRYSYVLNNPVMFTDPSGNMYDDGCRTEGCSGNPYATVHIYYLGGINGRPKYSSRMGSSASGESYDDSKNALIHPKGYNYEFGNQDSYKRTSTKSDALGVAYDIYSTVDSMSKGEKQIHAYLFTTENRNESETLESIEIKNNSNIDISVDNITIKSKDNSYAYQYDGASISSEGYHGIIGVQANQKSSININPNKSNISPYNNIFKQNSNVTISIYFQEIHPSPGFYYPLINNSINP